MSWIRKWREHRREPSVVVLLDGQQRAAGESKLIVIGFSRASRPNGPLSRQYHLVPDVGQRRPSVVGAANNIEIGEKREGRERERETVVCVLRGHSRIGPIIMRDSGS